MQFGAWSRIGKIVVAAVALAIAMPATAQFSDSFKFLKAVRDKDGEKVTQMIGGTSSTLINTKDYTTGEGALHIVVKRRDDVWLRFLLASGANPNIRDNQGNTPLMTAAQLGFPEGISTLIDGQANINLANNRGETPLITAVQQRDLITVRLLMAGGADASIPDHVAGMSARDYAARDTRSTAILRLIDDTAKTRAPAAKVSGPGL